MLANVIFIVTYVLTEILASSAFSSVMRATARRPHDVGVAVVEMLARRGVELADQQEVRVEEVADDAAERDELRAVAEAEVAPHLLSRVRSRIGSRPCRVAPGSTVLVSTTVW